MPEEQENVGRSVSFPDDHLSRPVDDSVQPVNDGSILAELHAQEDKIAAELDEVIREVEGIIRSRNPLSVLAAVWLTNAITDIESYSEPEHAGNDAYTEYVATLYLTAPFSPGEDEGLAPLSAEHVANIQDLVSEAFELQAAHYAANLFDPAASEAEHRLAGLRYKTLLRNTAGRYPAYSVHLEWTIEGILTPLDDFLKEHFGFSGSEAIALASAVERLALKKLGEHIDSAREAKDDILRAIKAYEEDGTVAEGHPDFLREGAERSPEEQEAMASSLASIHARTFMGDALLFTADELAAEAEVALDTANAFLNRMAVAFGEVNRDYFRSPSATPPLQVRPLLQVRPEECYWVEEPSYFCPVPNAILWTLRNNIEAGLNPNPPADLAALRHEDATHETWERYERARSEYAERRVIELFEQLLPGGAVYHSLEYEAPNRQGQVRPTEVDGIAIYDDVLFVIEVKAGALSPPARRGAPKSLADELTDDLLGEGHRQALRAKRYIEENDEPTFRKPDGSTIAVPKEQIRQFVPVVVTLEDLNAYTANLHDLQGVGILADEGGAQERPWAVNLFDLEVIAELMESPLEFVHYVTRRLAADEHVRVVDELDWLGMYLDQGLNVSALAYKEGFSLEETPVRVPNMATAIDDYMYYMHGSRQTPAPKPKQPLPSPLDETLSEIENDFPHDALLVAHVLLDIPHDARQLIARKIRRCCELAVETGERQVFGCALPYDDYGVTYVAEPPGTSIEAAKKLLGVNVHARKYQQKKERWLGLCCVAGHERWLHRIHYTDLPWEPNPDLDEALRKQYE